MKQNFYIKNMVCDRCIKVLTDELKDKKIDLLEIELGRIKLNIQDSEDKEILVSILDFWTTFGGETPMLVSADGLDVVPVAHNKTLLGVAETYDFIVTIPQNGQLEFRVMAQDGSGTASAYLGEVDILKVMELP